MVIERKLYCKHFLYEYMRKEIRTISYYLAPTLTIKNVYDPLEFDGTRLID